MYTARSCRTLLAFADRKLENTLFQLTDDLVKALRDMASANCRYQSSVGAGLFRGVRVIPGIAGPFLDPRDHASYHIIPVARKKLGHHKKRIELASLFRHTYSTCFSILSGAELKIMQELLRIRRFV